MDTLERLLEKTSRTFAMTIPLLEEPLRGRVAVAYLLFRIADTFEDAERWPRALRRRALLDFAAMVLRAEALTDRDRALVARWAGDAPSREADYVALVGEAPRVLAALAEMPAEARSIVALHVVRTADGMARVVEAGDDRGGVALGSVAELRAYCYVVAGIVGELLTALFLAELPALEGAREALEREAAAFGEALQLVNILKDQRDDARDGRSYLPSGADRAELFALAREDLARAGVYVATLQSAGAPRGVVAFCALPVLLAREALAAVERAGPGSKVPRERVFALAAGLDHRLDVGAPALDAA
ncbi:MAG: squalene/phytoene synthase family protein [Polyangiales bacterium]